MTVNKRNVIVLCSFGVYLRLPPLQIVGGGPRGPQSVRVPERRSNLNHKIVKLVGNFCLIVGKTPVFLKISLCYC